MKQRFWGALILAALACEPVNPAGTGCSTGTCGPSGPSCCSGLRCEQTPGDPVPVCRAPATQPPIASITITPDSDSVEVDRAVAFGVFIRQPNGTVIDQRCGALFGPPGPCAVWSTSDPAVALARRGLVVGVTPGIARITASIASRADTVTVRVLGPPGPYVAVAAGGFTTCGLSETGAAYCWGPLLANPHDGPGGSILGVRASYDVAFASLSVASGYACGLTAAGTAYCWGSNWYGRLGTGDQLDRAAPALVRGDLTFTAIGAASSHTCALATDGSAYCWGRDAPGSISCDLFGNVAPCSPTPRLVPGDLRFTALTVGNSHACGLTAAGGAYCWGSNAYGQLGDGTTAASDTPVAVAGDLIFSTLSAGGPYTCGIATNEAAYCWGTNGTGQLGTGDTVSSFTPVPVAGGLAFASVSAGPNSLFSESHTCALTRDRAAYCWGHNGMGQLGTGGLTPSLAPAPVTGGLAFTALTIGNRHTCGIAASGGAYCWGWNSFGQAGVPSTFSITTPVRVSGQP